MVRVMKLALWFLLGTFAYGLWLRLLKGQGAAEVIDMREDEQGKFGVE